YHLAWDDFCDWYLEMAKPRWAVDDSEPDPARREDRRAARWVAWKVLDGILRLLHLFMPFVTEEIWQAIPHEGETLALAAWPKARRSWFDADAERQIAFLQELVVAVRNLRVESKVAPGKRVTVVVRGTPEQLALVEQLQSQIMPLARIENLTLSRDASRPAVAASAAVRRLQEGEREAQSLLERGLGDGLALRRRTARLVGTEAEPPQPGNHIALGGFGWLGRRSPRLNTPRGVLGLALFLAHEARPE